MKTSFENFLILILTGSFTFHSFAQEDYSPPRITDDQEKLEYFLKLTDTLRKKGNNPGLAIAIFNKGELLYKGGMGYRDLEKKLPVDENTLFETGSLTKAFTGIIASRLVQEGKIGWNDRVKEHYPDFKLADDYASVNATFLDLFTHRTGLAQHYYLQYGPKFCMNDIPEMLPLLSFDGSFREKYLYNNFIYTMAGIIEEKIDGRSWNEMVKEDIFVPLGMNNSFTSFEGFKSYSNSSRGYQKDGITVIPESSVDAVAPAGGISSTINDMSRWLKMLLQSGRIEEQNFLTEEQVGFLISPHTVKNSQNHIFYGIGWDIDTKRKTVAHDGRTAGQSSRILLMPEEKFGMIVLTNQQTDLGNLLTRYATNIFVRQDYERMFDFEDYIEEKANSNESFKKEVFKINEKEIGNKINNLEGKYVHPAYGTIRMKLKHENILYFEYYDFQGSVKYDQDSGFVAHTWHSSGKDTFPFSINCDPTTANVESIEIKIPYSKPLLFTKVGE